MHLLFEYMSKLTTLTPETTAKLSTILTERTIKPGTYLCDFKTVPQNCYFIVSGIIRGFTLSAKGTEYNISLFSDLQLFGPLSALSARKPSKLTYETLTESVIIEGNYFELIKLSEKHPDLGIFVRKMYEIFYASLENRTIELATLTAKDRYIKLKNRIPNIDNLIPQYHIASHLGITPIQLSRIRRDLLKK